MATDRYTSILAMRLQMEQQQQQQERAEALQREQMNDQRQMQALSQIVQSGRDYFNAMQAADNRDLKLAAMRHQQYLDLQKEARENEQHRVDQMAKVNQLEWKEEQKDVRAGEKRTYDTEERLAEEEEARAKAGRRRDFETAERLAKAKEAAHQKDLDRKAAQRRADTMTLQKKQAQADRPDPANPEKQRRVQQFEDLIKESHALIDQQREDIKTRKGARAAGIDFADISKERKKLDKLKKKITESYLHKAHAAQKLSLPELEEELAELRTNLAIFQNLKFYWLKEEGQEETTTGVQRPGGVRRPAGKIDLGDFVKKNRKNP